jgi:uracil-DNA glycosylase
MEILLTKIQQCAVCKDYLPLGQKPIVQLAATSKIMIISQAPGRRAHETGIPWNDVSGEKLREWMNVDEGTFYNANNFSIMPMGFCYPGKGKAGDLAPRPECAPLWHPEILTNIVGISLILLIGQYAQRHYLKKSAKSNLTETVKSFNEFLPQYFPLPHPSPRNRNWLKINPWFMEETIPALREKIKEIL